MSGTVYFIGASGCQVHQPMVKIGYTRGCPFARMRGLQTGSPVFLDMLAFGPGDMEHERALHECLIEFWSHGEWFHLEDEVWQFIWAVQGGTAPRDMIDPAKFPDGLRCDHAMNISGVSEGVYKTRNPWGSEIQ